jgi:predicted ArsR family transcriptional regulator
LENSLIENILGVRVQRDQERVSGLYKCQFTLLD